MNKNSITSGRYLAKIKRQVMNSGIIKPGKVPRVVRFGIFKGIKLLLDYSSQAQMHLGLYEREIYKITKKLSNRIKTAIDVGADEGEYTLYFLMKTSAETVITCEPRKESLNLLKHNLGLNNLEKDSRLKLVSKFITDTNSVKQCTINSLLHYIRTPCLIKVDVDGEESSLLHGAEDCLRLNDVRWLMETHSKELEEECVKLFKSKGYNVQIIVNAWWRLFVPEYRPIPHNRWLVATR